MHSNAIWNDVSEAGTCEKILETMFWKLELSKKKENEVAKCYILTQFEKMFWKLELRRNFWN